MSDVNSYYEELGYQLPLHTNPAEFILELVNIDFASDREAAAHRLLSMQQAWSDSPRNATLLGDIADINARPRAQVDEEHEASRKPSLVSLVITLLHRSFVKSYRDVVAYGIRLAMYLGKLNFGREVPWRLTRNLPYRLGSDDGHCVGEALDGPGINYPFHERHCEFVTVLASEHRFM